MQPRYVMKHDEKTICSCSQMIKSVKKIPSNTNARTLGKKTGRPAAFCSCLPYTRLFSFRLRHPVVGCGFSRRSTHSSQSSRG